MKERKKSDDAKIIHATVHPVVVAFFLSGSNVVSFMNYYFFLFEVECKHWTDALILWYAINASNGSIWNEFNSGKKE